MENFDLFLGRFHPLVVHLPIGFLILAIIFGFLIRRQKYANLKPAFNLILLFGTVSAFIAVVLGFLLAGSGGYDQAALGWHKWMGILMFLFSLILYAGNVWFKIILPKDIRQINLVLMPALLVLIMVTGHLGGNLTHGSTYLTEYAPQFIKKVAGHPSNEIKPVPVINIDSAVVFRDLVYPVLEAKCQNCHNMEKKKGELVLLAHADIVKGGESGNTVVPGNVEESELIKRIILPADHDDVMPPDGKTPLTENEIMLLKWWVETGAEEHSKVARLTIGPEMLAVVESVAGIHKQEDEKIPDPDPLNAGLIADLKNLGFLVKPVAQESNWYEIDFSMAKGSFSPEHMKALQKASENILWLYLNNSDLGDSDLKGIDQLKFLEKLRLDQNPVTDQSIQYLSSLTGLKYLNLYATNIGNASIEHLSKLPRLKKLYLWQTKVDPEAVALLEEKECEVIFGNQLDLVQAQKK